MTRLPLLSRLWYRVCWFVCFTFVTVLFRFRWTGAGCVPKAGPVLLVSNHQSHLDPVLAGVACPRQIMALARRSLFVGPFGWLIRSIGAFPIDLEGSGISGLRTSLQVLKGGATLLVFPEGTRSADGRLGPFLTGFCALARRSGAAIVPVTIVGSSAALPRGSALVRPVPIRLVFGEPITSEEIAGLSDDQLAALVRSQIAANMR
jgi:1-acyl-sn-glycerol-3-phosphate acyltransferase